MSTTPIVKAKKPTGKENKSITQFLEMVRRQDYNSQDLILTLIVAEIIDKNLKFRKDKRCGSTFQLDNGNISECDPYNDMYYCCSKWGYCGDTSEHCKCSECVDYRKHYSLNITSKLEGMHCHNWINRKNVLENYN